MVAVCAPLSVIALPEISVTGVEVTPSSVYPGEQAVIYVIFQNTSPTAGIAHCELTVSAPDPSTTPFDVMVPGNTIDWRYGPIYWTPTIVGDYLICADVISQEPA